MIPRLWLRFISLLTLCFWLGLNSHANHSTRDAKEKQTLERLCGYQRS